MNVQANSGNARIGATGQITTFQGEPLLLSLQLDSWEMTVQWIFDSDPKVEDVAVGVQHDDERLLVLRCINFDGADGRGTGQPLQIATSASGHIFLHFRVFLFGKTSDRTIHYTVYIVPLEGD